ncbi:hypothetical protein [Methanobacterium alcaliphilum]|uniref:hypothetical protein n=1 Tax=Methanobacterium alcaliphilum TaxID=392018 RepID=UPI00200B8E59|nr:hypothetical protein [Methanobacterium alcaliphilum]MCK9151894.1 hypothetical protein [Methanobacterium alcaliphilum]
MDWGIDKKLLKNMLLVGIVAISLFIVTSAVILTNNATDSDYKIKKDNVSPKPNSTINNSFNQTNDLSARKSLPYTNKHQSTNKNTNIIDSSSSSGYDNIYWDSKYVNSWKTYAYGTSKLKILAKWEFTDIKNTKKNIIIQQTIIIREDPDNKGMAFVEITPKMSGKSSWLTWTSMQKNKNAVKFYWNAFRKTGLVNGFWS